MKLSLKMFCLIVSILSINLIFYSLAFSCKYTVRDIGFTDLGSIPYRLYFYVDDNISEEIISSFQRISYAALLDANVEAETININKQTQHHAMDYFRSKKIESLSAVILAASDGSTLILPFTYTKENYNESAWQIIENVVTSPLRDRIIESVAETYGVVLFIQGKDKVQNNLAQKAVSKAIKDISQVLKIMPKPIKELPQIVVMTQQEFSREQVLLWSLGVNTQKIDEPRVVILYGRCRRIGPLLKGDEINKDNVFNLLALVGSDCECGLDRSVMLGKMIPLRWDRKVQSNLNKSLGFDVESPMVKAEMSQILSLSPSLQGQNKKAMNPLTAYSEGIIKYESVSSIPTVSSNQFRETMSSESTSGGNSVFRLGIFLGVGFILIVLLIPKNAVEAYISNQHPNESVNLAVFFSLPFKIG